MIATGWGLTSLCSLSLLLGPKSIMYSGTSTQKGCCRTLSAFVFCNCSRSASLMATMRLAAQHFQVNEGWCLTQHVNSGITWRNCILSFTPLSHLAVKGHFFFKSSQFEKGASFIKMYFSVKSINVSVKIYPFSSFITRWIVLSCLGYCAKLFYSNKESSFLTLYLRICWNTRRCCC